MISVQLFSQVVAQMQEVIDNQTSEIIDREIRIDELEQEVQELKNLLTVYRLFKVMKP